MNSVKAYVVIPCYNEEEVLSETSSRMKTLFDDMKKNGLITDDSKVIMVDDGSRDKTWSIISELCDKDKLFGGIKLAKNAGHQNALLAGLMTVKDECDCAISIDADLQDDINVIPDMIRKYQAGCEVVYGVRNKRETDTFFKRTTAVGFYKLMQGMGVDIVFNHADYRLMGSRALSELEKFEEVNLFLRGIVPLIGYKTDCVYYDRSERFAGESKYPLKKMLSFAFDGITSFSVKPIKLVWTLGILITVISAIIGVYDICENIWKFSSLVNSAVISVWFLGGVQLISVGVIGEYIGKIYREVKKRPRFIIETRR